LLASGKRIAWLVSRKLKRRRKLHRHFLTPRNRDIRRYWRRVRKRGYLAQWRQRLREQGRCHHCGGESDFNFKSKKPFYYCAPCRDINSQRVKQAMREIRARNAKLRMRGVARLAK
jgi:hypothetical protein